MNAAVLETVGLGKAFGALRVADDISFRLQSGARHALIGPNGAGKTSFVNLVTGRLLPESGSVRLKGNDITRMAPDRRVREGLCRTFQISSLFSGLSVAENVFLSIAERERVAWQMVRPAGRYRAVIEEAYAIVAGLGLGKVAAQAVGVLSYGQQRLVEIAVALALKPTVLLLDEPAAGVPSTESAMILDVLEAMPQDLAILLIEHDMDIVFRFARRITVLERGRIMVEGTPDEIAANEDVRRVYFGEGDLADV